MTNHKAIYSTIKEREELLLQITEPNILLKILRAYFKKLDVFPTNEFEAIKYKNDLTFCNRLRKYLLDNNSNERVKEINFNLEKKIINYRMDLKHKFPLIFSNDK